MECSRSRPANDNSIIVIGFLLLLLPIAFVCDSQILMSAPQALLASRPVLTQLAASTVRVQTTRLLMQREESVKVRLENAQLYNGFVKWLYMYV